MQVIRLSPGIVSWIIQIMNKYALKNIYFVDDEAGIDDMSEACNACSGKRVNTAVLIVHQTKPTRRQRSGVERKLGPWRQHKITPDVLCVGSGDGSSIYHTPR